MDSPPPILAGGLRRPGVAVPVGSTANLSFTLSVSGGGGGGFE